MIVALFWCWLPFVSLWLFVVLLEVFDLNWKDVGDLFILCAGLIVFCLFFVSWMGLIVVAGYVLGPGFPKIAFIICNSMALFLLCCTVIFYLKVFPVLLRGVEK